MEEAQHPPALLLLALKLISAIEWTWSVDFMDDNLLAAEDELDTRFCGNA